MSKTNNGIYRKVTPNPQLVYIDHLSYRVIVVMVCLHLQYVNIVNTTAE